LSKGQALDLEGAGLTALPPDSLHERLRRLDLSRNELDALAPSGQEGQNWASQRSP
jgi:hypothetical protein